MTTDPSSTPTPTRDGTSQAARFLRALDPDSVPIDERSTRDLLAFARAFSRELRYHPADAADPGTTDWRGLFEGVDLDEAVAYASAPERFDAGQAAPYARPHFALLLVFLQLLGQGRAAFNGFTRRHLEYFYRDVLRMTPKPAVPDRVHVLVDLDAATARLALPAGTALSAGKDVSDRDLVYRTAKPLVANRVQVDQVRSLHLEISVTGIADACPPNLDDAHREAGFVEMMKIALGRPNPGDALPVDIKARPPLYPGVPPRGPDPLQVGFAEMSTAAVLIGQVEQMLGMPSFDDYRTLVSLRRQRHDHDAADWTAVNTVLVAAGRLRAPGFDIHPFDSTHFDDNVAAALGRPVRNLFDRIEEVETMEDAYTALRTRRAEVWPALAQALAPLTLDAFESMMQVKTLVDLQWDRIDGLLETAGRRIDAAFSPVRLHAASGFDAKLAAALPKFAFANGFDGFNETFTAVERYFYMSAESFQFVMALAMRPRGAQADDFDWQRVYEVVAAAHREMIYAQRRAALLRIAQPGITAGNTLRALGDMLAAVVGEVVTVDAALNELYAPPAAVPAALAAIAGAAGGAPDWERAVQALEIAQRNRQNFKDPVAERVQWRNLYPAPDATAVLALAVASPAQSPPRWKTFGRVDAPAATDPPPPAVLGWALASPLLMLSEGQRRVELTLGFAADPERFDLAEVRRMFTPGGDAADGRPLQVLVSTAEGWLEPDTVAVTWADPEMRSYPAVAGVDTSSLRTLVLSFTLAPGQPALRPLVQAVHGIDTAAPVLRLMMRPYRDGERFLTRYETLRKLRLLRAQLEVRVQGLEHLLLQTEQGPIEAPKPFEPFGIQPAVGARLYLGHPEIVGKKLTSLQFRLQWMGLPAADLGKHYANYSPGVANTSFKVMVALSEDGVLRYFSPAQSPAPAAGTAIDPGSLGVDLFDAADATRPVTLALRPPAYQGRPEAAVTTAAAVRAWNRHLVWELNPVDFQHAAYPVMALQKSLRMAAAIANRGAAADPVDSALYQVNPPYTPKLKSQSLAYSAGTEFALAVPAATAAAARTFHVHPFGYTEHTPGSEPGCPLLPPYDDEGELYIGLRHVDAPQNVALLFQVAEGSANPDVAPEAVRWSYLSGNRWHTLQDGSLLDDASRGFINTGIVELALPAARPSSLLPGGLYWIRAAIGRASAGVCDMVSIHPNAALAVFDDLDNAADHLRTPLAPGRIEGPLTPTAGIAGIRQPYTSFGGRMAEQDASFHVRVSERLRHKRRALTAWDYERLVLERFPRLYKVKCLRADPAAHPRDPGRIVIVVIPDIRQRLPFDPFEPKVPADQIRDIAAFLQDKTPPFASVEVRNAHYVPVKVRCGVRFLPGRDDGYCRQRLMDELNRYLSPWAYDEGADIVIGGSVYANSIINFIDQRDYVDYIAGFKLFTGADDVLVTEPGDGGYRASAGRPDGVLVAARRHQFDLIPDADYRVEEFTGIDYMMVELDFSVA